MVCSSSCRCVYVVSIVTCKLYMKDVRVGRGECFVGGGCRARCEAELLSAASLVYHCSNYSFICPHF